MKRQNQLLLIGTGLIAGFLILLHFNSIPANSLRSENTEEKKYILETLLTEQAILKSRIVSLRKEVDEKEETLKQTKTEESMAMLEKMKNSLGLAPMTGPGLEIVFADSPLITRENVDVNNESLVHAADLRDIVNVLRISQAKAISINDQRILSGTPISCVGNSILINNSHTAPPFTIKAISDIEVSKNNLLSDQYLSELWKRIHKQSLIFEVYSKDQITIPVYNGDLKGKYIE